MRFGQWVRELRKAKELSQRALGAKSACRSPTSRRSRTRSSDFGDYSSEDLIRKTCQRPRTGTR